ncbi:MAG: hypothetical protein J0H40_14465 [Rhizobiales bacterium]|nr:hypothetical protein [Hyphomicrobiales bacterium]
MSIELIGFITLFVGAVGLFQNSAFLVYSFFSTTLLGSAAAFILTSLGSTNISPAHLLLGFLSIKLLSDRATLKSSVSSLQTGSAGFWLLLIVVYSALTAYFLPRLFLGETFIYPVRVVGSNAYTELLAPSTANLTQSVYLIGDFVCFFILSGYARQPGSLRVLTNVVLVTTILNFVFAFLDLVTYATGTTDLLSIIRNANYALLSDAEIVGFKRIVGSFIEASSFGAATLMYFAYTIKLWLLGVRPLLTGMLSAVALVALVFSTSTTAYVGLTLFLCVCVVEAAAYAFFARATKQMKMLIVWTPIVLVVLGLAVALNDTAATFASNMIDTIVFNKMNTVSGYERSAWNAQALQVFLDTFGFGAGNGSLRASTFPLAVLGSLGIVGFVLFGLFFVSVFRPTPQDPNWGIIELTGRRAARAACLASLISATISGALTDLGLPFFAFAAIACAGRRAVSVQQAPAGGMARNTDFKIASEL